MIIALISLNKSDDLPIYRQLTSQLTNLIKTKVIKPGYQLPGSRQLATAWHIHRKTVVAALDQLVIEGWLETIPGKGTFVIDHLNVPTPATYQENMGSGQAGKAPKLEIPPNLRRNLHLTTQNLHLDDGLPDPRLAPTAELARAYKHYLTHGNLYARFTYGDTKGHQYLRKELCEYLGKTRAMKLEPEQILITRGVTQALYLCIQALLHPGDKVAVAELNWESANANFQHHGVELIKVKVDEQGLDTDHLEQLLEEHAIKMIYTTPHHQYPTTVIMPAARRLKLIQLARKHAFYVFEDDYDYDFHYSPHPVMPIASADHGDFVIYAGSFTKAISPVFRVGYLVAHANQIDYISRIRRMVDRQGDVLLELSIAELIKTGVIQRYLKKNRKIYQERRDVFGALMNHYLADYVSFDLPQGGMSVWTHFSSPIDLKALYEKALQNDLFFTSGTQVSGTNPALNATRLGFASSNENELETCVKALLKMITN